MGSHLMDFFAQRGCALPPAFESWLDRAARSPGGLGDFRVLSARDIIETWNLFQTLGADQRELPDELASYFDVRIRSIVHAPKRIPFASFNGDVWLEFDYMPTRNGSSGQIIKLDPESLSWAWLASDFDEFLRLLNAGHVPRVGFADADEDEG